jgi:alpha-L-fucosidase 2
MFGAALPVSELLLQSVGGTIRLFPAWPKGTKAAFATLRTEGGFLVSAEQNTERVVSVRIESTAGGALRVLSPWNKGEVSRDGGTSWSAIALDETGILRAETQPGEVVMLRAVG